jgi:hypothetical protein
MIHELNHRIIEKALSTRIKSSGEGLLYLNYGDFISSL